MKELFHDLMNTDGIQGVAVLSFEGEVLFEHFPSADSGRVRGVNWRPFTAALGELREADLIFERLRVFIKRAEIGYLIVFVDVFSQLAMVRLSCDLLLPGLKRQSSPKGLMRFFRSRR